jgi:hypothetical protein
MFFEIESWFEINIRRNVIISNNNHNPELEKPDQLQELLDDFKESNLDRFERYIKMSELFGNTEPDRFSVIIRTYTSDS